jgi:hypothetical protein
MPRRMLCLIFLIAKLGTANIRTAACNFIKTKALAISIKLDYLFIYLLHACAYFRMSRLIQLQF